MTEGAWVCCIYGGGLVIFGRDMKSIDQRRMMGGCLRGLDLGIWMCIAEVGKVGHYCIYGGRHLSFNFLRMGTM